ncbi:MAG: GAF domain-containing protein [Novosphingobium sp.]
MHDTDESTSEARLTALRHLAILDTPPEAEFDDIVEIVAALCDVPIALVSFVDRQRQWFKAKVGLELAETPIEQSVCALVIRQSEVFVIEDLAADPRTAANPLVTAPGGIRFYAGAPLVTGEGVAIGSLCAIDVRPRPGGLTTRQASAMQALARQVMQALETRRINDTQRAIINRAALRAKIVSARLERSEARRETFEHINKRSRSAQEAGGVGTFELDLTSDLVQVSPEFCRLFGLPVRSSYLATEIERQLLDDDVLTRSTALSRAEGTAALDVEYRVRRADDGEVRWISRRAAFESDTRGQAVRMRGTVHDVTERRLAGERTEALLRLGDRLRDLNDIKEIAAEAASTLSTTLQAARCGYASVDLQAGTLTIERDHVAGSAASIAGTYPIDSVNARLADLRAGETRAYADTQGEPVLAADLERYRAIGVRAHIEVPLLDRGELRGILFVHDDATRAWSDAEIGFTQGVADRTYAAVAKARAEDERQLLHHELGHRLKNNLAMIQAVASNTLRGVTERAPVEAFSRRLIALSAAHDVLLQQSWHAAQVEEVIAGVLDKLGVASRIQAEGPSVPIGARAVLGVSLLIHELATNAMKHGALSVPEGKVTLAWSVDGARDDAVFHLAWRESGGPVVRPPESKSFGSRLISMGLAGSGGAELHYHPAGLEAAFVAPLIRIKPD